MSLVINTSDELREFIPELTYEKDWNALKPRVQLAEDDTIRKVIGPAMLNTFRALAQPEESGSPSGSASASGEADTHHAEALFRLRRAIAFLVAFDMTKTGDVFFTSSGLQTISSNTNKSAFEYQKRDMMNDYAEKLDTAIDDLLEYMEEHKDSFGDWTGTSYYTATKDLLVANATQFSQAVNINNSRRTFMVLRPFISDNETLYLVETLGEELYLKLKDFVKDPSTATDESQKNKMDILIGRYLVPALANYSMADAINMVSMRFAGEFVTFASWMGLNKNREQRLREETHDRTQRLVTRGSAMLKKALDYIISNAAAFPEFTVPETENTGSVKITNDVDNHHFLPGF
jgi:hypothetical protein